MSKSAKGHKFFCCEKGKECGFITWDEPTSETCPNCSSTLFKARGGVLKCLKEGCGFEKKVERKTRRKAEK